MDGKRVLVLEDEPAVSEVVESYLRRDGFQPAVCNTVASALESLRQSKPAIMILDLGLPDGSGLDVLRECAARGERVPAIILSARGEESDPIVGLELGADDYITKPFSPRELMARVRALLRRVEDRSSSQASHGQAVRVGPLEIDLGSHEVLIEGKPANLTATEFRILSVLATSPGEVFTRASILDRLQDAGNIYERTLDRHINNLRKKIEQDSRNPSYVATVYGVGYKLRRP
jgi:two-component system, OmpR family, alkaline phosphatase synthesis response regulator PhoP